MARFLFDLRFALRSLRRSPLFTLVAVASLALGIGANTAIFTLIDQLMLRLLPVAQPATTCDDLVHGAAHGQQSRTRAWRLTRCIEDFQTEGASLFHVFCRYLHAAFGEFQRADRARGCGTGVGELFPGLGVRPAMGRVFSPEQDDRVYKGHPRWC